jgi:hypothetical protein
MKEWPSSNFDGNPQASIMQGDLEVLTISNLANGACGTQSVN